VGILGGLAALDGGDRIAEWILKNLWKRMVISGGGNGDGAPITSIACFTGTIVGS
jgi:hypothetical protein